MDKKRVKLVLEIIVKQGDALALIEKEICPLLIKKERVKEIQKGNLQEIYKEYEKLVKEKKLKCEHPRYFGENITGRTWCAICEERGTGEEKWSSENDSLVNYDLIIREVKKHYQIK